MSTLFVDVTSDVCERLFSRARLVCHYLRRSMTPESIELILYLWANVDLWNVQTVAEVTGTVTLDITPSELEDFYASFYENLTTVSEN